MVAEGVGSEWKRKEGRGGREVEGGVALVLQRPAL